MDFDVALRQINKQYGTSVFDGRKSLNVLTDLQAFKSYPALRTIYSKFISIDGNNTIIQILDGTFSKKDVTKALNSFVKATGFRADMTEYLFYSLLSLVGNTSLPTTIAFPNEYDPYYKAPKNSHRKSLNKRHKILFVSILCACLLLFFIPLVFDVDEDIQNNSIEKITPQLPPIHVSSEFNSEQPSEPEVIIEETQKPNPVSDVTHPTNTNTGAQSNTKTPARPNNIVAPVVTESETHSTPRVKDDFAPTVDKSQYLSEARKYMSDPSTHYLADKYARLALQNGELEAKQIIDQLKNSGFYE